MARRRSGRMAVVVVVLAAVVGWPLYQFYDMMHPGPQTHDAVRMLYQVSLFQVELLNDLLNEAGRDERTGQLDALKQAVYSAGYTHERLMMAVGEDRLTPLNSVSGLLQWIIRLRIGGDRQIKPEEADVLRQAGEQFKPLYEIYGGLMSSGGKIISSQNRKLAQADRNVYDLLRKQLMQ